MVVSAAGRDVPPRLVVLLMVDQMRGDYVDRFQHQWTHGLKRLVTDGAWFRRADYPYTNTVTCAGHTSVSTGSLPKTHGVILNGWWDREAGKDTSCTADASVKNLGYTKPVSGGDSLVRLRTSTLSDELRAQLSPPGRSAAFSLKARGAAPLAGHRPDAVAWFGDSGTWVTSTAFAPELSPVLREFIAANPVESDFGKTWTRTLPAHDYLFEARAIGVTAPEAMTVEFPHALKGEGETPDAAFYAQWQESPYSDDYLGRMALAAASHLHFERGSTNLLGISFSALDKVGHDFGPNSHEIQDVLVRLDRTLGTLFDGLDRLVGAENYTVALTADHGVSPLPERSRAEGLTAGRIDAKQIVEAIEGALLHAFGPGKYVDAYTHTEAYLAPGTFDRVRTTPGMVAALRAAVASIPGVSGLFTAEELETPTDDPLRRRYANSHVHGVSGDLTVVYDPYWVDSDTGTSHGTPYAFDTHVPVLLMGHGIARGEYLQSATPLDVAPTLAFLAGVTLPRADGRVLAEAIAPLGVAGSAGKSR